MPAANQPLRRLFASELDQLRLQVELMGMRVDENLERTMQVLQSGDPALAATAIAADDGIDAMLVSLTSRCYDLLARENPVASDLRFVVSVLRMLEELERIGDLALRVVKLAPDHHLLSRDPTVFGILLAMAGEARNLYDDALAAWSALDLEAATALVTGSRRTDEHYAGLLAAIRRLDGPDAASIAVATLLAGRAFERIADHATIIGERLRYLLTGDPRYLATEVR